MASCHNHSSTAPAAVNGKSALHMSLDFPGRRGDWHPSRKSEDLPTQSPALSGRDVPKSMEFSNDDTLKETCVRFSCNYGVVK